MKKILAGALATMLSAYAYGLQLPKDIVAQAKTDHAIEEIRSGRLSFSRQCGWVDWGHARGDGPTTLIQHVISETPAQLSDEDRAAVESYMKAHHLSSKQYYPVVYYQQMKKSVAQVGTRGVYLIKKHLPKKTREGIAWRIFKEVSNHFEQLQGSAPYNLLPSTAASHYGIGDLTGDKIAFYRALRGYTKEDIAHICKPYSEEQSLKIFERQHHDPKHQKRWRQLPGMLSVPKIPRGLVKTVLDHQTFYGEYR